jgi:hypothetical protein
MGISGPVGWLDRTVVRLANLPSILNEMLEPMMTIDLNSTVLWG